MTDLVPGFVREDLAALALTLPDDALDKLARYLDQLLSVNETMNLTAVTDRDVAWRRLILDSLTLLPALNAQPVRALLDVGSGGGMPGIPLAIARPDVHVTLLDATGKKVAFHHDVIQSLGLTNCHSLKARAEDLARDASHRAHYDVVTSRAVGVMSNVLEYSLPYLRVGGRCLAMKGPRVSEELEQCTRALAVLGCDTPEISPAWPPQFGNELVIVSVRKRAPTPNDYPRAAGTPKTRPL